MKPARFANESISTWLEHVLPGRKEIATERSARPQSLACLLTTSSSSRAKKLLISF